MLRLLWPDPPWTPVSLLHPHPHHHTDQGTTVLTKNTDKAMRSFGKDNSASLKHLDSEEGRNGGC